MSSNEKQMEWIKKGKQIGFSIIDNEILVECALQKKNNLILLYYMQWDMRLDFDGRAKEKFLVFKSIDTAIIFINSLKINFSDFTPQKGSAIFNPNDANFNILM